LNNGDEDKEPKSAWTSPTEMTKVQFGIAEKGANLNAKAQEVRYAMFKPELKYIIAPLEDW